MREKYKSMGNNGRPCIYIIKYVQSVLEARINEYHYNSIGFDVVLWRIYEYDYNSMGLDVWFYEYNFNYITV